MPSLNWDDIEDIGIALCDAHPDTDPLAVRFTDLARMVQELDGFTGGALDPSAGKANESRLEAVQMAWLEEWRDRNG